MGKTHVFLKHNYEYSMTNNTWFTVMGMENVTYGLLSKHMFRLTILKSIYPIV